MSAVVKAPEHYEKQKINLHNLPAKSTTPLPAPKQGSISNVNEDEYKLQLSNVAGCETYTIERTVLGGTRGTVRARTVVRVETIEHCEVSERCSQAGRAVEHYNQHADRSDRLLG